MEGVRAKLGKRIVQALKMNDDGVHYAAIDVLDCLMQPMHNYYDLLQEQLNKRSLLMSKSFLTGFVFAQGPATKFVMYALTIGRESSVYLLRDDQPHQPAGRARVERHGRIGHLGAAGLIHLRALRAVQPDHGRRTLQHAHGAPLPAVVSAVWNRLPHVFTLLRGLAAAFVV